MIASAGLAFAGDAVATKLIALGALGAGTVVSLDVIIAAMLLALAAWLAKRTDAISKLRRVRLTLKEV